MTINPVLWTLVAMVACLHVTHLIASKLSGPYRWVRLCYLVLFPCVLVCSGFGGYSGFTGILGVAFLCGVYLAVRAKTTLGAILSLIVSMGAGILGSTVLSGCRDNIRYVGRQAEWEIAGFPDAVTGQIKQSPTAAMAYLWGSIETERKNDERKLHPPTLKPGFLDQQDAAVFKEGPFVYIEPVPQWYSWFTGLYIPQRHTFRISTPGGPADFAANRAELVETDAAGNRIGTPIPADAKNDMLGELGSWDHPFGDYLLSLGGPL